MALTLAQGAQMIGSVGYYNRVRSGMVRQARTVMAEAIGAAPLPTTMTEFAKRKALAYRILTNPDGFVNSFLSAVAADSGASLTWYQPTNIASSTNANPSVVTTNVAHGLVVGDVVEIATHLVNTTINGVWTIATVGSSTTFTVPHPAAGAGVATGWVMKMETDITINFTIGTAFGNIAGTYSGES